MSDSSIPTLVVEACRKFSDRVFLVDHRGRGGGQLTYAWLLDRATAVAGDLRRRELALGDRVLLSMDNTRWSPVAYLGVWLAGGTPVPVNPTLTAAELAHVVAEATPRFFIADADRCDAIERVMDPARLRWFYAAGGDRGDRDLGELPPSALPERVELADVALILFTSGTTGSPKGVELEHPGMVWAVRAWNDVAKLSERDVVYAGLPLFHIYALVIVLACSAVVGARLVIAQGFSFPRFLREIIEHRVTLFLSVPPVFELLATDRWGTAPEQFSPLRLVVSAAAPLTRQTYHRAGEVLGTPAFYEGYGITETSSIVSFGPIDVPHRVGSCGRPAPGVAVRVVDAEGKDCERGASGEVWIRSPGIMRGYRNNPEATARALIDGWYRSGDVGHLDADGYLYITDRIADVVFVNGANVYPREIEEALMKCAGVERAAVVRMRHPPTGEAPRAFVVRSPDSRVTAVELLAALRTRLAPFKLPKRIEFVDAIPTSASGKISRRELEAQP